MKNIWLFLIILSLFLNLKVFAIDAKEYHNLIMKAYKHEDINKINKLSDEVIKNYPNLGFGYFFKGLALDMLGDYKSAIDYYNKSMQFKPIFSDHYQNRGLAYLHDKQYDKAIVDFDKALELDPNNSQAIEQRHYAINAQKGIIITTDGNVTNYQSVHDPFYLAQEYYNMPEAKKKEIIDSVKNYSDDILPIYYIVVAEDIYSQNKNLAAFLYAIVRYRSIQDVSACKDNSANGAINGLPYAAEKTSKYISQMDDKKLANLLQKVLDWDKEHPNRPEPKWICYHGMEVFTNNGKVSTISKKEFEIKKDEIRNTLSEYVKNLQK